MAVVQMKEATRFDIRIGRAKYFFDYVGGIGAGYTNSPDAALTGRRDYRGNGIVF